MNTSEFQQQLHCVHKSRLQRTEWYAVTMIIRSHSHWNWNESTFGRLEFLSRVITRELSVWNRLKLIQTRTRMDVSHQTKIQLLDYLHRFVTPENEHQIICMSALQKKNIRVIMQRCFSASRKFFTKRVKVTRSQRFFFFS